jgi:hypothetical protein
MLIRPLASLVALSLALPAIAQTPEPSGAKTPSGNTPQRVRSVTLIGDQKCPESTEEEVVVCARISPGEQYRIPKELRNEGPVKVENQAWAAKTDRMDEIAREAGGLPNTCSPVGSGGQTGCTQVMLERARADARSGASKPPR